MDRATDLIRRVEEYCHLGSHRTGTAGDLATGDWLERELVGLGAEVNRWQALFDRWVPRSELTDSGGPIPHEPLAYSFLGRFETDTFDVVEVEGRAEGDAHGLDPWLGTGVDGTATALVLDGPPGLPVAANRAVTGSGPTPVLTVPADLTDRLSGARYLIDAQLEPALCEITTAWMGPSGAPQVVLTTPLSGWFACAGERGPGIGLLAALLPELAERYRVAVVACSGHEIAHLGLDTYFDDDIASATGLEPGAPVIHLGASIAATEPGPDGEPVLASTRYALLDGSASLAGEISAACRSMDVEVIRPPRWPGEGGTWRERHGGPVLSFVGRSHWFHTPGDVWGVGTTPEALTTCLPAVERSVGLFLEAHRN
ncbi:MAG TPA: hypothetical protein ENI86_03395 [Acidimicrobiales bacterium]|nr:hypothetical protein [Acidimicrobiales bacterium]